MDALTFLLFFLLSIACLTFSTQSKEGKLPLLVVGGIIMALLGALIAYEGLSFQQISSQVRQISFEYPSNSTQSPMNQTAFSSVSYDSRKDYSTLLFGAVLILSGGYSMWTGVF